MGEVRTFGFGRAETDVGRKKRRFSSNRGTGKVDMRDSILSGRDWSEVK